MMGQAVAASCCSQTLLGRRLARRALLARRAHRAQRVDERSGEVGKRRAAPRRRALGLEAKLEQRGAGEVVGAEALLVAGAEAGAAVPGVS